MKNAVKIIGIAGLLALVILWRTNPQLFRTGGVPTQAEAKALPTASPAAAPENLKDMYFAGGCFWGVEELFRGQKGVLAAVSGYTGGTVKAPTYRQVCSGRTGHAEAVQVFYDSTKTDYETLCKYFLEIHDPTQKNRQGPDVGSQYRSAIFYLDDGQRKTAETLLEILRKKGYDVQTKVEEFQRFWNAEPYHQDYYEKNGRAPYCHFYKQRF